MYVYLYIERGRPSEGVCGVARHGHASLGVALGRRDAQEEDTEVEERVCLFGS